MDINLAKLIELQRVDERLQRLHRAHLDIPQEIERLQRQAAEHQQRLQAAEAASAATQKALRQLELEEREAGERLGKTQGRLLSCKTNEEYRATLAEIDYLKNHRSELETKILEHLERVEELQSQVAALREEVRRTTTSLERQVREKQEEFGGLAASSSTAESERAALLPVIEEAWLRTYDKIRAKRPGVTVVQIEGERCLACHMSLPPQFVQEIRHNNSLATCPHCSRILYYREPQPSSDA